MGDFNILRSLLLRAKLLTNYDYRNINCCSLQQQILKCRNFDKNSTFFLLLRVLMPRGLMP